MSRKVFFDYRALPLEEIAERYQRGESWRALAVAYGCPDDKSLQTHVTAKFPELKVRDHAQAQRARREREGAKRRRTAAEKPQSKGWWQR